MPRDKAFAIRDKIMSRHVLISVFDETGLEALLPELVQINLDIVFYPTASAGEGIKKILGENSKKNYMSVETFTGLLFEKNVLPTINLF